MRMVGVRNEGIENGEFTGKVYLNLLNVISYKIVLEETR